MMLTSLQAVVDQVAASETYKDLDFEVQVDVDAGKENFLWSAQEPPNFYDWDVKLNATDATLTLKDGIEL